MVTKQIPLTQGKFTLVDEEDFEYLNQWKWYPKKHGNTFYAIRNGYSKKREGGDGSYSVKLIHTLILPPKTGVIIDHIDGNGLNNSRSNLRYATHQQNVQNKTKRKNSLTGYKGVIFIKHRNKFEARIFHNKKSVFLGQYDTAQEASEAYKKAAIEFFGEFAKW